MPCQTLIETESNDVQVVYLTVRVKGCNVSNVETEIAKLRVLNLMWATHFRKAGTRTCLELCPPLTNLCKCVKGNRGEQLLHAFWTVSRAWPVQTATSNSLGEISCSNANSLIPPIDGWTSGLQRAWEKDESMVRVHSRAYWITAW